MATTGIRKSISLQTTGLLRPATGFPAWPASAVGRQVAVGRAAGKEARILWVGKLSATDNVALWRRGEVDFNKYTFSNVFPAFDTFTLRAFTNKLWFAFNHGSTQDIDDGIAVRTKDAGVTWDEPYALPEADAHWIEISQAIDGRFWGITDNTVASPREMKVWYNDDPEADGGWVVSLSIADALKNFWQLAVHPLDANIIVVAGEEDAGGSDLMFQVTEDRGGSWANRVTLGWKANVSRTGLWRTLAMTASGRVIASPIWNPSGDVVIKLSDDLGVTWSEALNLGSILDHMIVGVAGDFIGGKLYVIHGDQSPFPSPYVQQIYWSQDDGLTWGLLATYPMPSDDNIYQLSGLAYNASENALYVLGEGGRPANENSNYIMRLKPAAPGGTWTDVSDQAVPVGAVTKITNDVFTKALAVIP